MINDLLSAREPLARLREYAPRAAKSLAPKLIRGPVKWRIKAAPASGSAITLSIETMSATSGTWIKPPRPITSTGIPAERSALSSDAI